MTSPLQRSLEYGGSSAVLLALCYFGFYFDTDLTNGLTVTAS